MACQRIPIYFPHIARSCSPPRDPDDCTRGLRQTRSRRATLMQHLRSQRRKKKTQVLEDSVLRSGSSCRATSIRPAHLTLRSDKRIPLRLLAGQSRRRSKDQQLPGPLSGESTLLEIHTPKRSHWERDSRSKEKSFLRESNLHPPLAQSLWVAHLVPTDEGHHLPRERPRLVLVAEKRRSRTLSLKLELLPWPLLELQMVPHLLLLSSLKTPQKLYVMICGSVVPWH